MPEQLHHGEAGVSLPENPLYFSRLNEMVKSAQKEKEGLDASIGANWEKLYFLSDQLMKPENETEVNADLLMKAADEIKDTIHNLQQEKQSIDEAMEVLKQREAEMNQWLLNADLKPSG